MKRNEKQDLRTNLLLIKVVNENYIHISQLEELRDLYINSIESEQYIPKHYPFLVHVTGVTINSAYNEELKESPYHIDNAIEAFKAIYGKFDDEVSYAILDEFEELANELKLTPIRK